MPVEDFGTRLDAAVRQYNDVVTAYGSATVRRVIHHVVPLVTGEILATSHVPAAGAAGEWLAERVLARLLPLPPSPNPAGEEGVAIAMAQPMMPATWSTDRAVGRPQVAK